MRPIEDYASSAENQWCPGCPNFGIQTALKRALAERDLPPHEVCLVSGIGQAAKIPHYVRANVFNGLHGRAIPAAIGIHVANPRLTTIVSSGDGDLYGEGGNHLLHAFRRNPDLTVIVHDNRIYALTKGQGSPTTPRGEKTRLQVDGVEIDPAQILATAIVHGCTFVARGFAGDIDGLTGILSRAIAHRGLSLVAFPIGILYEIPPRETFATAHRARVGNGPLHALPPIERSKLEEKLSKLTVNTQEAPQMKMNEGRKESP